jgi:hypothetical protein
MNNSDQNPDPKLSLKPDPDTDPKEKKIIIRIHNTAWSFTLQQAEDKF